MGDGWCLRLMGENWEYWSNMKQQTWEETSIDRVLFGVTLPDFMIVISHDSNLNYWRTGRGSHFRRWLVVSFPSVGDFQNQCWMTLLCHMSHIAAVDGLFTGDSCHYYHLLSTVWIRHSLQDDLWTCHHLGSMISSCCSPRKKKRGFNWVDGATCYGLRN